jgi:endoglucanase
MRALLIFVLVVVLAIVVGVVFAYKTRSGQSLPLLPTATSTPKVPHGTPVPTLPAVGAGYWHTEGTSIVDAYGRRVRIAGVTWYGMESTYWVPAGLDYQPYTSIMDLIKKLGFNAIRLPYSNQLVETNPIVTQSINANPQFRGKHALDVIDAIVNYAKRIGLKIILDDHRSAAAGPHHVNILDEPLWYTRAYPESSWIHDWQFLARRYLHNDAVIGFDLRNEPHTNGPGPWDLHAYLYQGATWGPYGGIENTATDWHLAAERGGNAALSINPHLLMFVEGLQLFPDTAEPDGVNSYWWGSILTPVRQYPVVLDVAHQLVYSPHDWGPFKYDMPWFHGMTYASAKRVWRKNWSFIVQNPHASYAAPLWIGEFGTCTDNPQCVDDRRPSNHATWLHFFLRFLRNHPSIGWSFYALNGTNSNDHRANNGIVNPEWTSVANASLLADLKPIQR